MRISDWSSDVCSSDLLGIGLPQQPVERVEDDHGPRIADMGVVVDGRAADIHRHPLRVLRDEILFLAGQRVVKLNLHGRADLLGPEYRVWAAKRNRPDCCRRPDSAWKTGYLR